MENVLQEHQSLDLPPLPSRSCLSRGLLNGDRETGMKSPLTKDPLGEIRQDELHTLKVQRAKWFLACQGGKKPTIKLQK